MNEVTTASFEGKRNAGEVLRVHFGSRRLGLCAKIYRVFLPGVVNAVDQVLLCPPVYSNLMNCVEETSILPDLF